MAAAERRELEGTRPTDPVEVAHRKRKRRAGFLSSPRKAGWP
jgi:hypothetical protein